MNKRILLGALCLLLPLLGHSRDVELKFTNLGLPSGASIQLSNGVKIKLSTRHPSSSEKIQLPESNLLYLYDENVDLSQKEKVKPICAVRIQPELKVGNVLLLPAGKNGMLKTMVLDYAQFQNGGICFLNSTGGNIAALIDKEKKPLIIPPKQVRIYNPKLSGAENVSIKMAIKQADEEAKLFFEGPVRLRPTARELAIIYTHPQVNRVVVKGIADY